MAKIVSNGRYETPVHIRLLENMLLDVVHGKTKRLIVNMPPRHGKSELISKYFPFWLLLNFPQTKLMLTSYESSFAASWGRKIKDLLVQYGNTKNLNLTKATENRIVTNEGGELNTAGVGGAITGKGADILIIDDPVKNEQDAHSPTIRNRAWEWFNSTAFTRLEPDGKIIIIQTRWHSDDLAGRLIKEQPDDWTVLNLPAFAQADDPLGREYGQALWAERFDIEALEAIRKQIGQYWFSALYQQEPVPSDFQIFRQEWFENYYDVAPPCSYIIQTWDTAYELGEKNDYSVCATWGLSGNDFYLLDLFRKRVPYHELKGFANSLHDKWKPKVVLIEQAGSGRSLIQDLLRKQRVQTKPITPVKKELRAHSVTPYFEQRRVFFPRNAGFMHDFVIEHIEFPSGSHDDQVDTTTMSIEYLSSLIRTGKPKGLSIAKEPRQSKQSKYKFY